MNPDTTSGMDGLSTMRLYGSAIAIVSGSYSLLSTTTGLMVGSSMGGKMAIGLGLSGWAMLLLGFVVLVHGIVLLTPVAVRFDFVSGPLMILYAVLMLLTQALLGLASGFDMDSSMGMTGGSGMGSPMTAGMIWDVGMVAIAVLMLISGLIMTTRKEAGSTM